ncbi:MAG: hypothetical protein ABW185_01995 [Sedimenticola sp.]
MLGGPDGAILSKFSIQFGIPVLLLAASLLFWVKKISSSRYYYALAPFVVSIAAWLVALLVSQNTGFYFWLYGVPGSFIAAVILYIGDFVVSKKRESYVD